MTDRNAITPPMPTDELKITRGYLSRLEMKATFVDNLQVNFCHWVREAAMSNSLSICDEGLKAFCEEHSINWIPRTKEVTLTVEYTLTVPADFSTNRRGDDMEGAMQYLIENDRDWDDVEVNSMDTNIEENI